jgi:hypothetical protein
MMIFLAKLLLGKYYSFYSINAEGDFLATQGHQQLSRGPTETGRALLGLFSPQYSKKYV